MRIINEKYWSVIDRCNQKDKAKEKRIPLTQSPWRAKDEKKKKKRKSLPSRTEDTQKPKKYIHRRRNVIYVCCETAKDRIGSPARFHTETLCAIQNPIRNGGGEEEEEEWEIECTTEWVIPPKIPTNSSQNRECIKLFSFNIFQTVKLFIFDFFQGFFRHTFLPCLAKGEEMQTFMVF